MTPEDPPDTASDEDVITAVLAGQLDAYAQLVQRYERRIRFALVRMVGNGDDADELTQEVFVRAYFALPRFDPTYRFSTWIYQIAANLAINFTRRRSREVRMPPDAEAEETFFEQLPSVDAGAQPAAAAEQRAEVSRLRRAMADMPPDMRQVLVMRHVLELSYQEICDATGLPMGTVKSRLDRARRKLAQALST